MHKVALKSLKIKLIISIPNLESVDVVDLFIF